MDIITITILMGIFVSLALANRIYPLLGMISGIFLTMLALMIQISGFQIQTGTSTIAGVMTYSYADLTAVYPTIPFFDTLIVLCLGAIGIFIFIKSVTDVRLK